MKKKAIKTEDDAYGFVGVAFKSTSILTPLTKPNR